jgi:hypothetical protein
MTDEDYSAQSEALQKESGEFNMQIHVNASIAFLPSTFPEHSLPLMFSMQISRVNTKS